jgi:hypothetical protein
MPKAKSLAAMKKEFANKRRQITLELKKQKFEEVLGKGKVETLLDAAHLYFGLSRKAVELAAYREILFHARCGCTAQEIIDRMEVKICK